MAFIVVEQRLKHPLVEFDIFRNRLFVTTVMMSVIMQATFISFIFWMIFLQDVIGVFSGDGGNFSTPCHFTPYFSGSFFRLSSRSFWAAFVD